MLRGRKVLKRLRTAVFIIVVSGIFLGSLHASRREPRVIRIGEIKPVMSFSRVCVQGIVMSGARILNDGTRLCIITDETGSLPLFLYRASGGEDLRAGSRIAATGRLAMGSGSRMCLRVPDVDHIEVLEEGRPTTVRGKVVELSSPPRDSRAPYRLLLERPGGRMEVVHWFQPQLEVVAGDQIEAEGTLGLYQGRMQIKVNDAGNIRLQPEE